jgi:hypothetical protein
LKEGRSDVLKIDFICKKLLTNMTRLDRIEKGIEALQLSQLKTDAQLAKTERILSGIGINMGYAAEEFFAHSLQEKKMLGKIRFDAVALQLKGHKGKVQDEFDVVLYNGESVGIVEVKYKVHPADVEKLVSRKLPNFKALFPKYADAVFYLGIAGMSIPKEADELAEGSGIAVLRQKGDLLVMNNNLKGY